MEERAHMDRELNEIDEELEKLFDRFADLISRRKRLIREREAKPGPKPSAIEKRSPTYVKHHKR